MTETRSFGSSGRESHDASAFYDRFPVVVAKSGTYQVKPPAVTDALICGDATDMADVADNSVALVVTSPPYFAGKDYELDLDWETYQAMLSGVWQECWRVLQPGGRIAVNVAGIGRKPYRPLHHIVAGELDGIGFDLRGEIVWRKAAGASGSCAWGTFQSPANPTLRDLTERVVVASKLTYGRWPDRKTRAAEGLPHESTISKEEFMAATLDVWDIRPESAKRVGHPAPFPIELPRRLIELYTYKGELVLDPFIGSGTTALACIETGRRYVGYDTDPDYIDLAHSRIHDVEEAA